MVNWGVGAVNWRVVAVNWRVGGGKLGRGEGLKKLG